MNEFFEKIHPGTEVSIPGFKCERGVRADGVSWLRIFNTVTVRDGFDCPEKHIVTVFSDGTVQK